MAKQRRHPARLAPCCTTPACRRRSWHVQLPSSPGTIPWTTASCRSEEFVGLRPRPLEERGRLARPSCTSGSSSTGTPRRLVRNREEQAGGAERKTAWIVEDLASRQILCPGPWSSPGPGLHPFNPSAKTVSPSSSQPCGALSGAKPLSVPPASCVVSEPSSSAWEHPPADVRQGEPGSQGRRTPAAQLDEGLRMPAPPGPLVPLRSPSANPEESSASSAAGRRACGSRQRAHSMGAASPHGFLSPPWPQTHAVALAKSGAHPPADLHSAYLVSRTTGAGPSAPCNPSTKGPNHHGVDRDDISRPRRPHVEPRGDLVGRRGPPTANGMMRAVGCAQQRSPVSTQLWRGGSTGD